MRKLVVFNQVTLDGYFADASGDMGWAHNDQKDEEWNAFVAENANAGGLLLFGRITYELMAGYWPTPHAIEHDPIVAERMNQSAEGRVFQNPGKGVCGTIRNWSRATWRRKCER